MAAQNILLVDNDRLIAEMLKRKLERHGYIITDIATNGIDAIRSAKRLTPDLAFIDTNLKNGPGGIETAIILREIFEILVIFLSGDSSMDTIKKAQAASPEAYLTKPFDEDEIVNIVDNLLTPEV